MPDRASARQAVSRRDHYRDNASRAAGTVAGSGWLTDVGRTAGSDIQAVIDAPQQRSPPAEVRKFFPAQGISRRGVDVSCHGAWLISG